MPHGLAIDDAAWASRWRERAVRDKAVLSLGLVLCALVLPAWPGSVLVAAAAVALTVGVARTPARLLLRSMRAPLAFIVIGAVSVAITVTTTPSFAAGVTQASTIRAAEVSGHALAGTLAVLLLALTTPMVDLLGGLRRIGVPAACVEVAGLVYRMLFVLLESLGTIRESQTARLGYSSPRRSLASAASLTAAVLTRSWDRARRLEQGLAGRETGATVTTLDRPGVTSPAFLGGSLALLLSVVGATFATTGTVLR